jgi:hypothetical protein
MHGSSGQWVHWLADLKCDACRKDYAFLGLKLVRKVDAELHVERVTKLREAEAALMDLPVVRAIRSTIAARLDAMPTKAARHRWLAEHKLVTSRILRGGDVAAQAMPMLRA